MQTMRTAVLGLLMLCMAATTQPSVFKTWVSPDHFDQKTIMGEPPADDSDEHKAEIDKMLSLQTNRTEEEAARCVSEEDVTVFAFANVLGDEFVATNYPQTSALMMEVYRQTKVVSAWGKDVWKRPRPPIADQRIKPCVKWENSYSYPSGHATRGIVWATLLAEIFPEKKDALMAKGREIGTDRSLAGMHWPSDVAAGQKLGAAVAEQLLKDPDFRLELAKVKDELLAVSNHVK